MPIGWGTTGHVTRSGAPGKHDEAHPLSHSVTREVARARSNGGARSVAAWCRRLREALLHPEARGVKQTEVQNTVQRGNVWRPSALQHQGQEDEASVRAYRVALSD